ncbi:hypothetical protein BS47DRAFT_1394958 [Hydnum rufescens UP504]|uniref:Uncharacterized protein n=1 Tax=Hydnum rufescens UP504 TaxID=1448309 RepID=A0A9P6AT54_9AGAM|nr:hypothetical protein BS47DRAFT_1394958 [Hydnum rufescens UP504]
MARGKRLVVEVPSISKPVEPSRRLRGVAPPPFSDDPEQHRPARAKALTAVSQAIPLDHSAHAPPDDLHNAAAEAVSLAAVPAKASSLHDAPWKLRGSVSLGSCRQAKALSLHDAALEAVSLDSSAQAISLDHSAHAPPNDLHNAAAEVVSLGSRRRAKASSLHDAALEAVSLGSSAQAVSLDDSVHPPHDPSDAATKALSLGNSAPVHHKDVDADGPYEQVESEAARLKIVKHRELVAPTPVYSGLLWSSSAHLQSSSPLISLAQVHLLPA